MAESLGSWAENWFKKIKIKTTTEIKTQTLLF